MCCHFSGRDKILRCHNAWHGFGSKVGSSGWFCRHVSFSFTLPGLWIPWWASPALVRFPSVVSLILSYELVFLMFPVLSQCFSTWNVLETHLNHLQMVVGGFLISSFSRTAQESEKKLSGRGLTAKWQCLVSDHVTVYWADELSNQIRHCNLVYWDIPAKPLVFLRVLL